MKKKLLLALVALLAIGLMFMGCPAGDDDDDGKDPNTGGPGGNTDGGDNGEIDTSNYGTNLVTEAAILAATGHGGTEVEKVSDGVYKVTGTVTDYSNWDNSVQDKRIVLNIQADAEDEDAFFVQANRFLITIEFPEGATKPIEEYTEGFRVYLENTKATENTAAWAGTWQHEYREEYDEIGGVGTITINRDLTEPEESDEVGDYQHLVIVLVFEDEFENEEYTFTISNVGVYGEGVDSDAGRPDIHDSSNLEDATYTVDDDDVTPLKAVSTWLEGVNYTRQWYSNTENSNTNGTAIEDEINESFTPPVDTEGVTYYYCIITREDTEKTKTTRAVKITVTSE